MMGLYNGCYFIGAIVSTWLEYGIVDDTKGELNWRLPMATQLLPCIIVLAFVYFLPESPRWLMSRGREDEARAILAKYAFHPSIPTLGHASLLTPPTS